MFKCFKHLPHGQSAAGLLLEYNGKANLYRNGRVALGVNFSSGSAIKLDDLWIEAGNEKFHALDWEPFSFSGRREAAFKFDLNQIINSASEGSLKELTLIAAADGKEYRSPSFNIAYLIQ